MIGHDFGALICWLVAEEHPDLVTKLVTINCPVPRAYLHLVCTNSRQLLAAGLVICIVKTRTDISRHIFTYQFPYLGEILFQVSILYFSMKIFFPFQAQDYHGVGALYRNSIKNRSNFTDIDLEYYKYVFSKPCKLKRLPLMHSMFLDGLTGPINYYRALSRLLDDYTFNIDRIQPKTLIIWSEKNPTLLVDGAFHSKAYCIDAELRFLPTDSHFLQIDEPQTVSRLIEEFMSSQA